MNPDLVWFNAGASIFGRSPWLNVSGLLTPMFMQHMGIPTVVTVHELAELTDLRALNAPGGVFAKAGARLLTKISSQADLVCLTMKNYAEWLAARGPSLPPGTLLMDLGSTKREIVAAMDALRETGDTIETLVPHSTWPLPTYREMLFIK